MQILGIIGGLGPETTAKFQLEIIWSSLKINHEVRPPFLSWNVPVPLKMEEDLILHNKGHEFLPLLIDAARILENAGATFLVMPCNTLHLFAEEIKESITIPFLSIIDETIKVLKMRNIREIGILATSSTIKSGIFTNRLQSCGIKILTLSGEDQELLDEIIHKTVTGVVSGEEIQKANMLVTTLINKGAGQILLACTDLQLIINKKHKVEILDTMQILAQACADKLSKPNRLKQKGGTFTL